MTTKELEQKLYNLFQKTGTYMCFEVGIPYTLSKKHERVDLLVYNTKDEFRCIELKVSVADFHSKCKKSFYGDYNYFAMPQEIYEKVKDEIPEGVGVYTETRCIKNPKKQKVSDKNKRLLLFALMQGLYRDCQKIYLNKDHKWTQDGKIQITSRRYKDLIYKEQKLKMLEEKYHEEIKTQENEW